jgi:hypothetical protein
VVFWISPSWPDPCAVDKEEFLADHHLQVDYGGRTQSYDLVMIGTDLLVPCNIRNAKMVLVQEGMTDPEDMTYHLGRWLLPPLRPAHADHRLRGGADAGAFNQAVSRDDWPKMDQPAGTPGDPWDCTPG